MGDPLAYLRAVHFAATIIAAGAVIFEVMVAAPAFAAAAGMLDPEIRRLRSRWSWLVWASLAVAAVSGAIWLVLLAADIYAAPIAEVWRDGGMWTVASETRFGQVSLARLAVAVLLAALLPMLRRSADRGLWSASAVVLAIAVLIGPAWSGHAGATPGVAGEFPLAADALHLLAAGAWLGGLPPLAMLLATAWRQKQPRWATVTAIAVQRFSLLGVISVSTLLASGIVNSWYEVGTLNNLFATSYGQLVLIKIALFAAMIALASINRFYLTPRLATAGTVRRLYHTSLAETGLGFAAVVAVGFLGAMAPASHTHHNAAIAEGAAFVHIHSNAGMADVTIMPGRVGAARATIRLWNDEFKPLAAEKLTFSLMLRAPGAGSKLIMRSPAQDQDGSWTVDGLELPQAGNWTVTIDATLVDKRRLLLDAPIVIDPEQ
ncbi:MAG: copper homeostasis membrane protein CopD [Xanthobacteraceae bacterium]